jgi:RNA polymerase sigma factor (sigma-70 family)
VISDVDELYRRLAPRLRQIVRSNVCAPEPVVDDACQIAWSRLIRHSERVRREAALSWLATTAVREAYKLARRDRRELSLDAELERTGELPFPSSAPGPAEVVELRERLREVGQLPERQQRLVWMHAAGLTYVEMADRTGDSRRTVERQLLRAKGKLEREAA